MLDIRINNESLQLPPRAQMEMEESNPFIAFGDQSGMEYSLPLEVPNTPKNARLLDYAGTLQRPGKTAGIDAVAFDNGLQHSTGKLRLEKIQYNMNRSQSNRISFYYLTGTSYFWQDLKDKRLRDIDMGGNRVFGWDGLNESGNGFWAHINRVARHQGGPYDYCFFPAWVDDTTWAPGQTTYYINWMHNFGGQPGFHDSVFYVPFVYLKKVLLQAFALAGWSVKGSILDDPQFAKVVFTYPRGIDWATRNSRRAANLQPRPVISFNLCDHLPDITLSQFLLALKNRFGWWYDIDRVARVVTIQKLQDVALQGGKDMTDKASPMITKSVLSETKIYAVHGSAGSGALNFENIPVDPPVGHHSQLPAPGPTYAGRIRLVISENNYVSCEYDDTNRAWYWWIYAHNTSDVVPAGANEFIQGSCTVAPQERNPFMVPAFLPRINASVYWPGISDDNAVSELQLTFYYGIRQEANTNNRFPFASHHIYDERGIRVGDWSLAMTALTREGEDVGMYARSFKKFLDRLSTTEEVELSLNLSRIEFMDLKFSDLLVVAGVPLYIKTKKYTLPYTGVVKLTCVRVFP